MYTLPTLMKINGHDFIDVLKVSGGTLIPTQLFT